MRWQGRIQPERRGTMIPGRPFVERLWRQLRTIFARRRGQQTKSFSNPPRRITVLFPGQRIELFKSGWLEEWHRRQHQ